MNGLKKTSGLEIDRHFTTEGVHPFEETKWDIRQTLITLIPTALSSSMDNAEVPALAGVSSLPISRSASTSAKAGVPTSINKDWPRNER